MLVIGAIYVKGKTIPQLEYSVRPSEMLIDVNDAWKLKRMNYVVGHTNGLKIGIIKGDLMRLRNFG